MSSSVDNRIVTAKFDNAQFERGAAQTMSTLDKLKKLLTFDNAKNGLSEVQKAADGFHMNGMENAVNGVSKSWVALATVVATVVNKIVNMALEAGRKMVSGMLGPVKAGLAEYETNLNSIQTILANTGLKGQKGLDKVNGALQELNEYSDLTIYNFSEMARNIGTFTAAGVKLQPATDAIKGIANLAAVSGSSSQQASTAMYQLSQALATGTVKLMDWNSVVNAGMGGKVFQEALKDTARVHGVAVDDIIKKEGSFRDSLQTGWLTSDILTSTLRQFAGDVTAADLAAEGFNKNQIKRILEMGKTATDAATKVKTFSQLMSTLSETAGSGWAQTWQLILGDFGEAKELFTGVNDTLSGFISASADARNKVLGDWKELGGRTLLIESIANAFHAVMDILTPIKEAFREIFPAKTGRDLYNLTVALHNFTEGLKVSGSTQDNIKRTFAGLFAVLDIGWTVVKNIVEAFFNLFSLFSGGGSAGGIFKITGGFGDMLVALHDFLVEGGRIDAFFDKFNAAFIFLSPLVGILIRLAAAVQALVTGGADAFFASLQESFSQAEGIVGLVAVAFRQMGDVISDVLGQLGFSGIFDAFNAGADKAAAGVDKVNTAFDESKTVAGQVASAFGGVIGVFQAIGNFLQSIGRGIVNVFTWVKNTIVGFVKGGIGVEDTLAVINTGFLIALYIAFRKFLKNFGGVLEELKGTFKSASGVLDQVTNNLKTMQTEVRARAILQIAAALALLAGALFVLSKIDTADLAKSLAAVVGLMSMLATSILVLEKKTESFGGAARVAVLAGAMVLLAVAMAAMAGAIAILARLDTVELAKGIGSMAAVMAIMISSVTILEKSGGAGQMVVAAAGIAAMAAALTLLAGALKLYANLDLKMMAEGGAKMAAVLIALNILMRGTPDNVRGAASLLIIAGALIGIAAALKIFGRMSMAEIAKSLILLNFSLGLIAGTLNAMGPGVVKGAAALMLVAVALGMLTPSLIVLGNLDIMTIAKALGVLAGIFVVLGVAGAVLGPIAPAILALAGAVALLGVGLALIGGGMFAFATGLALMAASGAAGVAVLTASVIAVAELFPLLMHQFGLGLRALAVVVGESGPELVKAFSTVLGSLIKAVIVNTPKFARMLIVLIHEGLRVIRATFPDFVQTGMTLIINLLDGVAKNIGKITKSAANVIVNFLKALGKEMPRLVDAGIKFVLKLVNGVADGITKYTAEITAAGFNLATAIMEGMIKGLADAVQLGKVVDAAINVAKKAFDAAKKFLGISSPSKEFEKLGKYVDEGFAKGMVGNLDKVGAAMDKWNDLIAASMDASKAEIDDLTAELKELNEHPTKNAEEIEKKTKALEKAEALYKRAKDARKEYNVGLKDERKELRGLARQYDEYSKKIDDARSELRKAQDEFLSFQQSTTSKFGGLPEIDEKTTVQSYEESLAAADAANEKFLDSLNQLVAMGLDDATYQKLLDEGVGIQPFIDSMIALGPDAVAEIDRLTAELGASAAAIGSAAALELKQAGIDSARGFLNGLIEEQDAIAKQMSKLARQIVKAIKKELKIKSPSQVMEEIGKFTTAGLAKGLDKNAGMVEQSATNVADTAVNSIKSTLAKVADQVNTQVNTDPVIRPVLDLTQLNKDAAAMSKTLDKSSVAQASYGQALSISNEQAARIAEKLEATSASEATREVVFEQHNHSPKALPRSEVYRDTKNLLSIAKEALK